MWSHFFCSSYVEGGLYRLQLIHFPFKVFNDSLLFSFQSVLISYHSSPGLYCVLPDVVYCRTVFHEFWGILHNLWHFLIIVYDLVWLDFVVTMLQVRWWEFFCWGLTVDVTEVWVIGWTAVYGDDIIWVMWYHYPMQCGVGAVCLWVYGWGTMLIRKV